MNSSVQLGESSLGDKTIFRIVLRCIYHSSNRATGKQRTLVKFKFKLFTMRIKYSRIKLCRFCRISRLMIRESLAMSRNLRSPRGFTVTCFFLSVSQVEKSTSRRSWDSAWVNAVRKNRDTLCSALVCS